MQTHFKMMFAVAYNQLKDSDIAEGLVHNIFLRLWEKREQYTEVEAMDRYLVGAVKRAVMEYIRNKSIRSKHIDMLSLLSETTENYVDLEYEVNELQERVDQLINKLPHQCQVVYKLSREEGKSNKEISSKLDIAEKTVESHMTKALKYLRSNLTEY
ncbi:MAG: sigma-70 family RNA polymerase sigma factor [Bacteroidota bacterium]